MPGEITPGMNDMPDQGDEFGMADAASGGEELPMGRELK
jgi:hypothetical protein